MWRASTQELLVEHRGAPLPWRERRRPGVHDLGSGAHVALLPRAPALEHRDVLLHRRRSSSRSGGRETDTDCSSSIRPHEGCRNVEIGERPEEAVGGGLAQGGLGEIYNHQVVGAPPRGVALKGLGRERPPPTKALRGAVSSERSIAATTAVAARSSPAGGAMCTPSGSRTSTRLPEAFGSHCAY